MNKTCTDSFASKLAGVGVLIGNQGNPAVLNQWISQSGGKFDVIVDDGGHTNIQIITTLNHLWKEVNPGGLYFIEDLQVGRNPKYFSKNISPPMTVIMQVWIDYLTTTKTQAPYVPIPPHVASILEKYPFPIGLEAIFCQMEACVLFKSAA